MKLWHIISIIIFEKPNIESILTYLRKTPGIIMMLICCEWNVKKTKSNGSVSVSSVSQVMRWIWTIVKNKNYLPFLIRNQLFYTKISHIPSTGSRLAKNGDVATQLTGHNTIYERAIRNSRSFGCIMWRFFVTKSSIVILHRRIFTLNNTISD